MKKTLNTKKIAVRKSKYEINIDYPKDKEIISHREHYAIRVGTPSLGNVEVSIDGGKFIPCRYSIGYWWYDLV